MLFGNIQLCNQSDQLPGATPACKGVKSTIAPLTPAASTQLS